MPAVALALLAAALLALPVAADPVPGPDGSPQRYRATDNVGLSIAGLASPTYNFETGWNQVALAPDTDSGCIALGFDFTFYGNVHNCVYVTDEGYAYFAAGTGPHSFAPSQAMPSRNGPEEMIAAFWTNHTPGVCGGEIYTGLRGTAPNRVFIIEWRNMYARAEDTVTVIGPLTSTVVNQGNCINGAPDPPGPQNTFEIKLYETKNWVEVHIASAAPNTAQGYTGFPYAMGIEDLSGTEGLDYGYNTGAPLSGRAIRYYPNQPATVDPIAAATVAEGSQRVYTLTASDADGDQVRGLCVEATPTLGTLNGYPACSAGVSSYLPPSLQYVAPTGSCGDDVFTVRAQDIVATNRYGALGPETAAQVTVTCQQDAPTLDSITNVALDEDTTLDVTLSGISAGLGDPEPLQVTATSSDGQLLPNPAVTYNGGNTATVHLVPAADRNGEAKVTVRVAEQEPLTGAVQRTFKVVVRPVNDLPVASSYVIAGPSPVSIQPPVTDVDGTTTFALDLVEGPSTGTVTGTGPFVYKAQRFTCGPDSFRYRAFDGVGWSNVATVSVNVVCPDNFPPVAQPQQVAVPYMTETDIQLVGVDFEGDPLSFHLATPAAYGPVTDLGDLLVRYKPQESFCGEDRFTFRVSDGEYTSTDAAAVTLIVQCPADALPQAKSFTIFAQAGEPVPVVLSGFDPDGQPVSFVVDPEGLPAHGTLLGTAPQLTYEPSKPFLGMDTLRYRAYSGSPLQRSLPATVTLHYGGALPAEQVEPGAPQGPPSLGDVDLDGIPDAADNCPRTSNTPQGDGDGDGVGDLCDSTPTGALATAAPPATPPAASVVLPDTPVDADLDGLADAADNCPSVANPGQADQDRDRFGDLCDTDRDGDGALDLDDVCPDNAATKAGDFDGDGIGDGCDADADNDGVGDRTSDGGLLDNCQLLANPTQADADADTIGDRCDADPDGDGIAGWCELTCAAVRQRDPANLDHPTRASTTTLAFVGAGFLVVVALVVAALPFFAKAKRPEKPE